RKPVVLQHEGKPPPTARKNRQEVIPQRDAGACDSVLVRRLGEQLQLLKPHREVGVYCSSEGQIETVHPMPQRPDAVCGCCDTGWRTRGSLGKGRCRGLLAVARRFAEVR